MNSANLFLALSIYFLYIISDKTKQSLDELEEENRKLIHQSKINDQKNNKLLAENEKLQLELKKKNHELKLAFGEDLHKGKCYETC